MIVTNDELNDALMSDLNTVDRIFLFTFVLLILIIVATNSKALKFWWLMIRIYLVSRCNSLPEFINGFKIITRTSLFKGRRRLYIVECKLCKKHYDSCIDYLKKANSCGCAWKTPGVPRRLQHAYAQMKERCYGSSNVNNIKNYKNITICNEWIDSSKSFYNWALNNGYQDDLTLDRIDNLKDYSPQNCRWATKSQQQRNRKCSRFKEEDVRYIRCNPDNLSQADLARKFKVNPGAICRIQKRERFKDVY